eukprot:3824966-Amphidinium_carterae.2
MNMWCEGNASTWYKGAFLSKLMLANRQNMLDQNMILSGCRFGVNLLEKAAARDSNGSTALGFGARPCASSDFNEIWVLVYDHDHHDAGNDDGDKNKVDTTGKQW